MRQFLDGGDPTPVRSFHATDEMWTKVARLADARGVSMSVVVREAIETLPEPTVAPVSDLCSVCGIGPAAFHQPARSVCAECYRKERK